MRALVDAVAASIVAEVPDASTWNVDKYVPMHRLKGQKVLNVYSGDAYPDREQRLTGSRFEIHEIIVEYGEPADQKNFDRNEAAELAAEDVSDALQAWSLAHEAGFPPAWKMDWLRTMPPPQTRREFYSRYCRLVFGFSVRRDYT